MTAQSTVLQLDHAPGIDGGEIARLLAPVTLETFFAEYWNRRPLPIKGSAEKAGQLIPGGFGREDFFRAAHRAAETKGKLASFPPANSTGCMRRMMGVRCWGDSRPTA